MPLRNLSNSFPQKDANLDHKSAVTLMVHTTELENEAEFSTSYLDCLKGTNLRRTEIACVTCLVRITLKSPRSFFVNYLFSIVQGQQWRLLCPTP
jgi:SP family general alpha glucoside:H+ symporter-like MFS transporter